MERTIKPETLKTGLAGKLILDSRHVADRDASTEQLAGASRLSISLQTSSGRINKLPAWFAPFSTFCDAAFAAALPALPFGFP